MRPWVYDNLANQLSSESPQSELPARSAAPQLFRSNIAARGNLLFIGREDLLAQIADVFNDPARENVVVLHGPPGVGKSELAREFARVHREQYSGGTFLIDASADAIAINLAEIGRRILDLRFPTDLPLPDQGQQTFQSLGASPVLLIHDNVLCSSA